VSPPPSAETSSGPKARAGFSDAPVIGPTTMMIATTTPPITMPAKSPGERVSTIPRIANKRMKVPRPSANAAEAQLVDAESNDVCPMPKSIPVLATFAGWPARMTIRLPAESQKPWASPTMGS
jgi:hypothetical protein